MSDDLPLARPPGRLTVAGPAEPAPQHEPQPAPQHEPQPAPQHEPQPAPQREPQPAPQREPHAWLRYQWLWEAYYGATGAFAVHQIWTTSEPVVSRALATGLLGAIGLWYAGYGRRQVLGPERPRRPRVVFMAVMLVLLSVASALVPASSIALLAVLPLTLQALPTRRMLPTAAVMSFALAAGFAPAMVRTGDVVPVLLVMVLLFALVLPNVVWVNRIIWQSAERAELVEQLTAAQQEVSRLSHEAGVAAERQRLAGDLHDTIAQGLSSVVMLVQAADTELDRDPAQARAHLALAQRTARENLAEARALVAALTPAELAGAPLPEALSRLAARTTTRTTVTVTGPARSLPTGLEVVLLRAAQESLTNVAKHASASAVRMDLGYGPDAVVLEVSDDGCGFEPGQPAGGYGLAGMRARADQVGGTVTVDSAPGAGTTVRVRVPA